jgi:hypothetical protein
MNTGHSLHMHMSTTRELCYCRCSIAQSRGLCATCCIPRPLPVYSYTMAAKRKYVSALRRMEWSFASTAHLRMPSTQLHSVAPSTASCKRVDKTGSPIAPSRDWPVVLYEFLQLSSGASWHFVLWCNRRSVRDV